MKFLSAALVAGALFLTGCASTTTTSTDAASPGGTASPPPSGAAAPVYPAGALTPITSGSVGSRSVVTLAPPADMWDRIRRGFKMPDLDTDLVRDQE